MYIRKFRILFLIYDIHNLSDITFHTGKASANMIFFSVYTIYIIIVYIILVDPTGFSSGIMIFTLNRIDQIPSASFALFFPEPDGNKNKIYVREEKDNSNKQYCVAKHIAFLSAFFTSFVFVLQWHRVKTIPPGVVQQRIPLWESSLNSGREGTLSTFFPSLSALPTGRGFSSVPL